MNAPATPAHVRPDSGPVRAEDLISLALIRKLVSFDTTSRESNLALIEWARAYFSQHGVASTLTFDDDRRKANLFATIPARDGNATSGGIVLSGHTDVVPVDGQPWDTNPFEVALVDDRLVGRGVTDMKSFSAVGLAFVPEFVRRGLKRPLHFALSYDEEVGCIGVRRLIADVVAKGISPAGCIVGEPTGMQLVVAHKGKKAWRCRVRGFEAHSSLTPRGVNAVQIACEIVAWIARRAREFRDAGRQDGAYDIPYTTVHVGAIHGGTALNIVPRDCAFDFEIRHLPFDDPEAFFAEVSGYAGTFLPAMRAVDADTYIEFDHLSTLPGFDTHEGSEITALGGACNGTHEFGKVSFGTEASLFHNANVPTVICGPGHIAQAHQPNEWVTLDQIARCEGFMRRLADRVCAT
ncbi:MAG TPA: acetylornithine deacetylase [Casimicrobiaceae bacterium]|nr:acetylornithine deacetylase [Casimicrobiaceae bacterium]